jgi:hypothetical protein
MEKKFKDIWRNILKMNEFRMFLYDFDEKDLNRMKSKWLKLYNDL